MRKAFCLLVMSAAAAGAATATTPSDPIDLPTVLKLSGAQNADVLLAEEKLREAEAREDGTLWQMFPSLSLGVGYRNHTGRTQAVTGQVFDVDKESLQAGGTIQLQLELGEAAYRRLAAQQTTLAAGHGLEAQRRRSVAEATQAYFDLVRADLAARLHEEASRIAADYHAQVARAVAAGIASKTDELRASAQLNRVKVRQAQAAETCAKEANRLALLLRLRIDGALRPVAQEAALLAFPEKDAPVEQLLTIALARRPEIAESEALAMAAAKEADGARYGPLYPVLGVQHFSGGLGGSTSSARQDYASSADTSVTLTWRIGAGGLFDGSRQAATDARERQARLRGAAVRESITRELVDAHAETRSLCAQLELLRQGVASSELVLQAALRRKEFAVGTVLETVQSQQDALQAKLDYLQAMTEANKAQYRLRHAAGG